MRAVKPGLMQIFSTIALSQARIFFVVEILKFDDYNQLKKEYLINSKCLKRKLHDINIKLKNINTQNQLLGDNQFVDFFKASLNWT